MICKGMQCYVQDKEQVWLEAEVVNAQADVVTLSVKLLNGKVESRTVAVGTDLPVQNVGEQGVDDMIVLNNLHEPAILFNLKSRFHAKMPYTYTGDITIAINPYQWLPELYTEKQQMLYAERERSELPPHVYATSVAAYDKLRLEAQNQSILVSGESGAGKTETSKILMRHIAKIAGGTTDATIRNIINVTPLLESFGNAKTIRNDNSSRFGKFSQLQFDENNKLVGSQCKTYLLEKTRVVDQASDERNYHIFYQLLASSESKSFGLDAKASYAYLKNRDELKIDGHSDAELFGMTMTALTSIGLSSAEQQTLFKILAGVLQLGEVEIKDIDGESCTLVENANLNCNLSKVLGVTEQQLKKALCSKSMKTGNEVLEVPLNVKQGTDCKHALAKAIYARTFDWLVRKINASLGKVNGVASTIGILDIFGFEHFEHNSFEQLCINYANEKLQQKFTEDVFKVIQLEYEDEGISWNHISFADNEKAVKLIEGKMGIISLLNEEVLRPQGSEAGFVGKLATLNRDDEFTTVEFPKTSNTKFTICHYAGKVTYEAKGFLEKHQDSLLPDISNLMKQSNVSLLSKMFTTTDITTNAKGRGNRLKMVTVGSQFKDSLAELMGTIKETRVQYVRCIKPNAEKSSSIINHGMVVSQLRCAGVIEAIRIGRAGYPNRLDKDDFLEKFWLFAKGILTTDTTTKCTSIMEQFEYLSPVDFQIGSTKIYFKAGICESLNAKKVQKLDSAASLIQLCIHGYGTRKIYRRTLSSIILTQSIVRRYTQVRKYRKTRYYIVKTQTQWRGVMARAKAHKILRIRKATLIQAVFRGHHDRMIHVRFQNAAIAISAFCQTYIAKKRYQTMLVEHRKEATMTNELKSIQDRIKLEQVKSSKGGNVLSRQLSCSESVIQDAGGMIEKLQQDNARLRTELRLYKSNNGSLKAKADSLKNDREVLIAANHVKVFHFEEKLTEQKKQMDVAREEYETLRNYISKHMPHADVLKPASIEKPSNFFAFRKRDESDKAAVENESSAAQLVKNIESVVEQKRDETAKFLRASAQRMSRVHFWSPPAQQETSSSLVGDAIQSVTTGSFFRDTMFAVKKAVGEKSPQPEMPIVESVSLDNLPATKTA